MAQERTRTWPPILAVFGHPCFWLRPKASRTRLAAAIHEAGHAVAAYHLGDPTDIRSVEITVPPEADKLGYTDLAPIHNAHRPENEAKVHNRVAVLMAGHVVEERAAGWVTEASIRFDLVQATNILVEAQHPSIRAYAREGPKGVWSHPDVPRSVFKDWIQEAACLAATPARWREVKALTRALLTERKLGGAEVREIIARTRTSR